MNIIRSTPHGTFVKKPTLTQQLMALAFGTTPMKRFSKGHMQRIYDLTDLRMIELRKKEEQRIKAAKEQAKELDPKEKY